MSFDENDSGTVTTEVDYSDIGSKYRNDETYAKSDKSDKDSGFDGGEHRDSVPQINTDYDVSGATPTNTQRRLAYGREPSILSNGSQDRPPSVSSFSSADLDTR